MSENDADHYMQRVTIRLEKAREIVHLLRSLELEEQQIILEAVCKLLGIMEGENG